MYNNLGMIDFGGFGLSNLELYPLAKKAAEVANEEIPKAIKHSPDVVAKRHQIEEFPDDNPILDALYDELTEIEDKIRGKVLWNTSLKMCADFLKQKNLFHLNDEIDYIFSDLVIDYYNEI